MRAPSVSGPNLGLYLGNDGNLWAVNPADGRGYGVCQAVDGALAPGGSGGGSGGGAPAIVHPAQISVYDDFINANYWTATQPVGAYPGYWMLSANGPGSVTPTNAQNGVIQIGQGIYVNGNLNKASGQFSLLYSNLTKIVARFVFLLTQATSYVANNESVVGFTHQGNTSLDGSSHLYGAYINYCPNFPGLFDWDTGNPLTPAGFTYGVYNGGTAQLRYKNSTLVPTVANNTWYEGVISMIPGVSCAFYIGPYGAPALDKTCTVASLITNTNTAGPIITMGNNASAPGLMEIDKAQYAFWVSEGGKALTDDQLYSF